MISVGFLEHAIQQMTRYAPKDPYYNQTIRIPRPADPVTRSHGRHPPRNEPMEIIEFIYTEKNGILTWYLN